MDLLQILLFTGAAWMMLLVLAVSLCCGANYGDRISDEQKGLESMPSGRFRPTA